MATATAAMELVDIRDTLLLVFGRRVPRFNRDIRSFPAAGFRSMELELLEEPPGTRSNAKDFLEWKPGTSQDMEAVKRLPGECPGRIAAVGNSVFLH